jgi:hypothetical protein
MKQKPYPKRERCEFCAGCFDPNHRWTAVHAATGMKVRGPHYHSLSRYSRMLANYGIVPSPFVKPAHAQWLKFREGYYLDGTPHRHTGANAPRRKDNAETDTRQG